MDNSWIKETTEERESLLVEYRKSKNYYDDGSLLVTCKFCGSKEPILSAPCCEDRKQHSQERLDKLNAVMRKMFQEE